MSGAGLVEVMVALVVLTVGVLGAVGLLAYAVGVAGEAARRAEQAREVGELHDSLLTGGAEGGERMIGGDTARWRRLDEGASFPDALELVIPAGREGRRDTLLLPAFPAEELP